MWLHPSDWLVLFRAIFCLIFDKIQVQFTIEWNSLSMHNPGLSRSDLWHYIFILTYCICRISDLLLSAKLLDIIVLYSLYICSILYNLKNNVLLFNICLMHLLFINYNGVLILSEMRSKVRIGWQTIMSTTLSIFSGGDHVFSSHLWAGCISSSYPQAFRWVETFYLIKN